MKLIFIFGLIALIGLSGCFDNFNTTNLIEEESKTEVFQIEDPKENYCGRNFYYFSDYLINDGEEVTMCDNLKSKINGVISVCKKHPKNSSYKIYDKDTGFVGFNLKVVPYYDEYVVDGNIFKELSYCGVFISRVRDFGGRETDFAAVINFFEMEHLELLLINEDSDLK